MNSDLIEINLLPEDLRQRRGIRLKAPSLGFKVILSFVGVLAVIVLAYMYSLSLNHEIKRLNGKISDIKKAHLGIEKKVALVDSILNLKKELESQVKAVQDLTEKSTLGVRLLEAVGMALPDEVRLLSLSEEESGDVIQVKLKAQALTSESVTDFIDFLGSSGEFSRVSLSNLSPVDIDNYKGFEFELIALISSEKKGL